MSANLQEREPTLQKRTVLCKICRQPVTVEIDIAFPEIEKLLNMATHPECYDKRLARLKAIEEEAMIEHRQKEWEKMCPAEFRKQIVRSKLDDPKSFDAALRWDGLDNLWLQGPSGMSKTRAAYQILKRQTADGIVCGALTHGDLRMRLTQFAQDDQRSFARFMRWLIGVDLLLIDDLGKGRTTPASEEAVFDLIDARYRQNKRMLITSQHTPEELIERFSPEYGEPLTRRFTAQMTIIEFNRKQKTERT